MKARVLKAAGTWNVVKTASGEIVKARLRGKLRLQKFKSNNPIVVGDWVELNQKEEDWIIQSIFPQDNTIKRKSKQIGKQVQPLAANIDQVVILASLKQPRTSIGFLDRILVSAEINQIDVCILFNKKDLLSVSEVKTVQKICDEYKKIGYPSALISVKKREGIEKASKMLQGKLNLLIGHSGVGKSSLVNILDNSQKRKTGKISDVHQKGRHTTTLAELLFLKKENILLIDAPGIKEFGLYDIKKEQLRFAFPEFKSIQNNCKFSNCLHVNEPECKVKLAAENQVVLARRYHYYLELLNELI